MYIGRHASGGTNNNDIIADSVHCTGSTMYTVSNDCEKLRQQKRWTLNNPISPIIFKLNEKAGKAKDLVRYDLAINSEI